MTFPLTEGWYSPVTVPLTCNPLDPSLSSSDDTEADVREGIYLCFLRYSTARAIADKCGTGCDTLKGKEKLWGLSVQSVSFGSGFFPMTRSIFTISQELYLNSWFSTSLEDYYHLPNSPLVVGVYILASTALRAALNLCPCLLQLLEPITPGGQFPQVHSWWWILREELLQ